jgi:hypothetical protein
MAASKSSYPQARVVPLELVVARANPVRVIITLTNKILFKLSSSRNIIDEITVDSHSDDYNQYRRAYFLYLASLVAFIVRQDTTDEIQVSL